MSRGELQRFFAEVAPRADTATAEKLDIELNRQLARRFNVFRYLRTDEMGFSKMIADLLDPAGDHGQEALFLELLAGRLKFAEGTNLAVGTTMASVEEIGLRLGIAGW